MKKRFDLRNYVIEEAQFNLDYAKQNGLTPIHFIVPMKYKPLFITNPKDDGTNLKMLGYPVVFSDKDHIVDLKVEEENG